jgi:hypothetical protein
MKVTVTATWPGVGEATYEIDQDKVLAFMANRGYGADDQAGLENLVYGMARPIEQEGEEILARES